ncbi:hypothetical protein DPMN_023775 [Dreissena polymorpha]|uniref:Uncharacterized protein n=1 Tax=Dreissena polymorpha TaxID=45954 RepID=A0A9D4RBP8_DREPO|nr:hypothetical protein DPMN_023775 [Dreissena polymorpha]
MYVEVQIVLRRTNIYLEVYFIFVRRSAIAPRLTGHRPDTANAFSTEAKVAGYSACLNTARNFALVTSNPFLAYERLEQMVSTLDLRGTNI